jgi:AAA family ATP:ADP antiporter
MGFTPSSDEVPQGTGGRPEGEALLLALALLAAFFGMASFYLLRPVRDALGIAGGASRLPLMMTWTLLAMVVANPLYAWAAARLPRRRFLSLTPRLFALMALGLGVLFAFRPQQPGLGPVFFSWVSVLNLFVVTVLWSALTDLCSAEQGTRWFGPVALGGTVGALAGAGATQVLLNAGLPFWSLCFAAAFALEASTRALLAFGDRLHWRGGGRGTDPSPDPIEGFRLVARDPYVRALALFMLLFTTVSTMLYVVQGQMVAAALQGTEARTAFFARLDLASNLLTLILQGLVVGPLLRRFRAAHMLLLLPFACLLGFLGLVVMPTLGMLGVVMVVQRSLQYGTDPPSRGLLFVPLSQDAKYKAKAFIDTFVYRTGDVSGAWAVPLLAWLALPAAPVAAGLSVAWVGVGLWIGRKA